MCFGSRSRWLGGLALIAMWGEQGRGLGDVLRCGLVTSICSGTSRRGYNYSGKAVVRLGEVGNFLEATVAGSGEVRRGSELGGDSNEQQQAARQQLCFVTQGRRKIRRKREGRGWLGQMSWAMRKNWTGPVEGRWAAHARLFFVFYFIY
jgi:hypothetical protein